MELQNIGPKGIFSVGLLFLCLI